MNLNNSIKYLSIVIGLIISAQCAMAQPIEKEDRYIAVGFHGGYGIADVNIRPGVPNINIKYKGTPAYTGGFSLMYMNTKYLGLQLELNYAQRGWKEVNDELLYTYTRTMDYMEIPLLTHVSIGKKMLNVSFNLGPYIALHRSFQGKIELEPGGQNPVKDSSNYFGVPVDNKIDMGFLFDLGIGVNTSVGTFLIRGRYTYGLEDIFDPYPDGAYRYSNMTSFNVGIAYQFPFYLWKRD